MALEIQGKLHEVFDTMQVTEKFKKREFIVEIDDNGYIQYVKFQLNQDKCTIIDNYTPNERIKVYFNFSGRQYTKKTGEKDYITNIVAWRLEKIDQTKNTTEDKNPFEGEDRPFEFTDQNNDEDILPF